MNEIDFIKYNKTENILDDAKNIIDSAKSYAIKSVNWTLVQRNWLLGQRIAQEELKGENRAEYGKEVIKNLSKQLTDIYGSGFDRSNLYKYLQFYKEYPAIVDALSRQSYMQFLDWTHFRILLQEENKDARYSVLKGSEQLFATKYKLCLPTEEQLRKEIESQKNQYYLAHPEKAEEK